MTTKKIERKTNSCPAGLANPAGAAKPAGATPAPPGKKVEHEPAPPFTLIHVPDGQGGTRGSSPIFNDRHPDNAPAPLGRPEDYGR